MHQVRPPVREWLSLALWPPVCFYGCYIAYGMVFGVPPPSASWHQLLVRVTALAAPLSLFAVIYWVRRILQLRYWSFDGNLLTRGHDRSLRVPVDDIESVVIGMPARAHWLYRFAAKIPGTPRAAAQMVSAQRAAAVVLRLRGRRLLTVQLYGKHHRGGRELMHALLERCRDRVQPASSYTAEETAKLALVTFGVLLDV